MGLLAALVFAVVDFSLRTIPQLQHVESLVWSSNIGATIEHPGGALEITESGRQAGTAFLSAIPSPPPSAERPES